MKKLEKAAKTANGRSRMCNKCPFNTKPKSRCTEEIYTLCSTSFMTGFRKGAEWRKMDGMMETIKGYKEFDKDLKCKR